MAPKTKRHGDVKDLHGDVKKLKTTKAQKQHPLGGRYLFVFEGVAMLWMFCWCVI